MAEPSTDRIEKTIVLKAPRARVWRALTNPGELGAWFRLKLPETARFVPGAVVRGPVTYEGCEHLTFEATVEGVEPERRLAWRWHPGAIDVGVDYSKEPTTLVVFTLEDAPGGTLLRVVESGFDALPPARRATARRGNDEGWTIQMTNIERHVAPR